MNATPQSKTISPSFVPFLAVPRDRGDEACEVLSPVAFKVWYRITRMTRGWQREEVAISYNEFKKACGIKDSHTISAAIKELVSKGFITAVKHINEKGRHFTSSYSLLMNTPAGTSPAPRQRPAPQPEKAMEVIHQTMGTPPLAYRTHPTSARGIPPVAPPRQPALQEAPHEGRETLRHRTIHTLIDTVELPCFQEQTGVEEEEAAEEREEATGRRADSRKQELRAALEALTRECNQAYCRMASSAWGTRARDESKQQLMRLREEQRQVQMQLRRLGRE